ncbi:MAG TPA: hypothetical protein VMU36_10350 [Spirochaetia bacterium]|nr:hypothetical protein [Spirochaetia bacterium]
MISATIDEELGRLRRELDRLHREADRLRMELARRPRVEKSGSDSTKAGVAARDLLAAIEDALASCEREEFLAKYRVPASDLLKLVSLCEDDAARAGPLVDVEARWFANSIRKLIV